MPAVLPPPNLGASASTSNRNAVCSNSQNGNDITAAPGYTQLRSWQAPSSPALHLPQLAPASSQASSVLRLADGWPVMPHGLSSSLALPLSPRPHPAFAYTCDGSYPVAGAAFPAQDSVIPLPVGPMVPPSPPLKVQTPMPAPGYPVIFSSSHGTHQQLPALPGHSDVGGGGKGAGGKGGGSQPCKPAPRGNGSSHCPDVQLPTRLVRSVGEMARAAMRRSAQGLVRVATRVDLALTRMDGRDKARGSQKKQYKNAGKL